MMYMIFMIIDLSKISFIIEKLFRHIKARYIIVFSLSQIQLQLNVTDLTVTSKIVAITQILVQLLDSINHKISA